MRIKYSVVWWFGFFIVIGVAATVGLHRLMRRPSYQGPVRHVILISLDTTRKDHLGCYGNSWIRTPYLDALAAESILLTDYITVASTTLASHASLFTGKYPHSHGVPRNGFMVNRKNVMLAEILKNAGFHTVGFLGSFALDSRFDFAQGFKHYDQSFDILVGTAAADQNQRNAKAVTDAVIDYLERKELPQNLFLFVHYFDPHKPYFPPVPYDTMYGEGDASHVVRVENHPSLQHKVNVSRRLKRHMFRYAGEISYMDANLGRLLDYLKRRGILDDAILIVTSDHGEGLADLPFGELFDHGWTVYEPEIQAVCIIRLPGAAQGGAKYESPAASIDIVPTLTDYMGLPKPDGVEGRSLDLLNPRNSAKQRMLFAEATKPWERVETDPRWFNIRKPRCLRQGKHKYIRTEYRGREELYDLSVDPYERKNLLAGSTAEENAAIADDFRKVFEQWVASAKPLPTRFEPSQMQETIRKLRSLGYLSSGTEDESRDK